MKEDKNKGEPVALPERRDENQGDDFRRGSAHGFNACLVTIAKIGPLYTHAGPAEVEQLRANLETMRRKNNEYCETEMTLRAQLAEAQALLRDVLGDVSEIFPTGKTANKVRSYLSASAEPSAPAEIDELRAAVIARRDLDRRIKEMGIPPHMDYWDQAIFDADARIDAALEAKS